MTKEIRHQWKAMAALWSNEAAVAFSFLQSEPETNLWRADRTKFVSCDTIDFLWYVHPLREVGFDAFTDICYTGGEFAQNYYFAQYFGGAS